MSDLRFDFCSVTEKENDIKHFLRPGKQNFYVTGKNFKAQICGKTHVKLDDNKIKRINLLKVCEILYGDIQAKHFHNVFKVANHLSYFNWSKKFVQMVIYTAMKNHTKHYEKLKKVANVCEAHLDLPLDLNDIDLTPFFKKNGDIVLTVTKEKKQKKTHNIHWKSLFMLYVIFVMGNVNTLLGGIWTPDPAFKNVSLTF